MTGGIISLRLDLLVFFAGWVAGQFIFHAHERNNCQLFVDNWLDSLYGKRLMAERAGVTYRSVSRLGRMCILGMVQINSEHVETFCTIPGMLTTVHKCSSQQSVHDGRLPRDGASPID